MYRLTTSPLDGMGLGLDGLDGGGLAQSYDDTIEQELNLAAVCSVCGCRHDDGSDSGAPDLFKGASNTPLPPVFSNDDYTADANTTGVVAVGGSTTGVLEVAADSDWFAVELVAGQTYVISLFGSGSTPLSDPYIRLRDSAGVQVAENDDANGELNSQLVFTARTDGTYYIDAQSYANSRAGEYTVQVAEAGGPQPPNALAMDSSVQSSFDTVAERDSYTVELTAGSTYEFLLSENNRSGNALQGETLSLYGADGTLVGTGTVNANGTLLSFTATVNGSYTLEASDASGGTGNYVVSARNTDYVGAAQAGAIAVEIGGRATGEISAGEASDFYSIEVTAGQEYTIFLFRDTEDALDNPMLRIFNGSNLTIAVGEDVSQYDWNTRIDFTATETGTLYLEVLSTDGYNTLYDTRYNLNDEGGYMLLVEESDQRADFSNDDVANFLINGFSPFASAWQSNTITYDISSLPAATQALALLAMQAWADLTPLVFIEDTSGNANITFQDTVQGRAYATSLGPDNNQVTINVASNWNGGNTAVDSYTYQTYLHEIGHALGLGHAGSYNAGNGNPINYDYSRLYNQDYWTTTLMSYFSQSEAGTGDYEFTLTPQIADIIAIQTLYGANTTTRSDNTTYGFNSTLSGSVYDFTTYANQPAALTLYDTGGIDTIDLSGFSGDQILNLNSEQRSTIGGVDGSEARTDILNIARDTVIENAIGGSGNDVITGNAANNGIIGGSGNDVLRGEDGNDTLQGRDGNDLLIGGSGNDVLLGQGGRDRLEGLDGNDILIGGGGNDVLLGQGGQDRLEGYAGNDLMIGGGGNDVLLGGSGRDRLEGFAGDDILDGGTGNDRLRGDAGSDTFIFTSGNDVIEDFASGIDVIDLNGLGEDFDTLSEIMAVYTQVGSDAVFDFGDNRILQINNIDGNSLTDSDFGLIPPSAAELPGKTGRFVLAEAPTATELPAPLYSAGELELIDFINAYEVL